MTLRNDVPQQFLKCISRLILLPLLGRTSEIMQELFFKSQRSISVGSEASTQLKHMQQQRAQSSCPLGKEKAAWSRAGSVRVPRNESEAIEVHERKELRNHRCNTSNKDQRKVRSIPPPLLDFMMLRFIR